VQGWCSKALDMCGDKLRPAMGNKKPRKRQTFLFGDFLLNLS
jgi:hypothetical protein